MTPASASIAPLTRIQIQNGVLFALFGKNTLRNDLRQANKTRGVLKMIATTRARRATVTITIDFA
jgi:uncharacterized membrane protein